MDVGFVDSAVLTCPRCRRVSRKDPTIYVASALLEVVEALRNVVNGNDLAESRGTIRAGWSDSEFCKKAKQALDALDKLESPDA